MEQAPEDERAAEAEKQPRAERADDDQASNVRGWFQPMSRTASADDTATSPASSAPSTASRAPSVPASPAGKTPGFRSDSAPAVRPNVLADAETVMLPTLGGKRAQTGPGPNARNGSTAAGAASSQATGSRTAGQRQSGEAAAVPARGAAAEGGTQILRAIQAVPVKRPREPAYQPIKRDYPSRRTSRARRAKLLGISAPAKRVTSVSRRLRSAVELHRLLIAVLTAIAVIVTTATLISLRLDASPRPSGAPPLDIPAPSKSQLAALGSRRWPTTPPESAPSTCKQVSLKGATGASVLSYLDDNLNRSGVLRPGY